MLLPYLNETLIEAGCDEAGRGCLAGAVFAAAVILPSDFRCEELNDSKQLSEKQRDALRPLIEKEALAWAVGIVSSQEIDNINILQCFFFGHAPGFRPAENPTATLADRRQPIQEIQGYSSYIHC